MKQQKIAAGANPPKPAAHAGKPRTLGKYELREEIGRGTCGVVYHGFDPFVRRDVAIKVGLPEPPVAGQGDTVSMRHNFFNEAHAAGILQHPHIVSVFDAGVEGELSYIVMEYVPGETLRQYTRKDGKRLSVTEVVNVLFKCAQALDYAHGKGVLHRDIKPSNVMLAGDSLVKIMDFSVAEIMQGRADGETGPVVGSPLYLPPEQLRGDAPSPRGDLYSLGMVGYELLAGEPPFRGKDMQHMLNEVRTTPAPELIRKLPEAPRELCELINRLLCKNPAERPASGNELSVELLRINDALGNPAPRSSRREHRDALRRLSFFTDFSDGEIEELLGVSSIVSYQAGDTIITEGEIDNTFYIIVRGSVGVHKGGQSIQMLAEGDCFGEMGFLTKYKRTASIIAATQVMLLKVNGTLMQKVSRDCQLRYYKVFTETLVYRLCVTSAQLSALKQGKH